MFPYSVNTLNAWFDWKYHEFLQTDLLTKLIIKFDSFVWIYYVKIHITNPRDEINL